MNILTDKIKQDAILNNISSFFDNKIYLVGGAVRDAILGKDTFDRDLIVVDCDAKTFSQKICEFFNGTFIPLDEENKIYRVVLPDKKNYLDITNPINNFLEEDILRRDLSINAIAVDIRTGEIPQICEPFIKDIQNKVINGIREENFTDDPLRLLRIFRFYSLLGFEISSELSDIVKKYKHLIERPAKERVQYEIMKLFSGKYCHLALLKMDECGLLDKIFPFVKELKQVPPNTHHHLDLFNHSIETVKQVQILYEKSDTKVKEHLDSVDFGGFSRLTHLKLACFMHDIGKFSTWTIEEDTNRHRFIKHDEVGAKLAPKILRKLCFSNKQIDYISYIIKKHMYPTSVVCSPNLNEKIMMRYIRKSQNNAIDNILIAQADRLSALGPEVTKQMVDDNINSLNNLLNFYLIKRETLKPLPKLLDGNEVMELLHLKQSPALGKILKELTELQISGEINTKQEAIDFVLGYK